MKDQLPSEIAVGSTLRQNEYGWTLDSFPAALAAAERLGIACVGGQFQFRAGEAVYEPFWISADSSERRPAEPWSDYVRRSCGEVAESFRRLVQSTDFRAASLEGPNLCTSHEAILDPLKALVFVAYFVTEQEHNLLATSKE